MNNAFFMGHGLGNDYIAVDPEELEFQLTPENIRAICDRHWGVGSDGILALVPSKEADFGLRIYNPDGSERFWRGNATPTRWDDEGNPTAGVDLNRNWWREDGNDYSELESQAFYWAWADFKPHYALDIHHQGTYFVEDEDGEDTNQMTTFSIGIPVWPEFLEQWVWDDSRRMAVAASCSFGLFPRLTTNDITTALL